MKPEIKHRRLYAFYNSKVLNVLQMIIILSLLLIGYLRSMLIPLICASVAFLFFAAYSLWIWIKKPERIVINSWLSNLSSLFTLYFLAIVAFNAESPYWYAAPLVAAIVLCFVVMIRRGDEVFTV